MDRLLPEIDAARQFRHRSRGRCQTPHQTVISEIKATGPNPLGAFQTPPQAVVSGNQGQSPRDASLYTGQGIDVGQSRGRSINQAFPQFDKTMQLPFYADES